MEVGFTVEEAGNGLEALDIIQKEKVDLALVDWNMPDMNGYKFIQEVRKDNAFKDMRMMMVTTETQMNKVVEALEAGANEYIMKPFHQGNDCRKVGPYGNAFFKRLSNRKSSLARQEPIILGFHYRS